MNLTTLWIVTRPGPRSTLADICFSVDIQGLYLQFLGGLNPDQIHGIYSEEAEAFRIARGLLKTKESPHE